eukprot:1452253-Pyramimonas_sp.AAC.1
MGGWGGGSGLGGRRRRQTTGRGREFTKHLLRTPRALRTPLYFSLVTRLCSFAHLPTGASVSKTHSPI